MASRTLRVPIVAALVAVAAVLALALLLTGVVGGNGHRPATATAGCGGNVKGDVEVVSRFSKAYASQYKRKMRLTIAPRKETMREWHAELYTFSGLLLGKSKTDERLSGAETTTIKLRQSMQTGGYTAVAKGRVSGCGEKQLDDVVKLRDCIGKLPLKWVERPTGLASDYNSGGYVSVKVAPQSGFAPLEDLRATLSDFNGVVYGTAELPRGSRRLIGEEFLNLELTRNLEAGRYTVHVTGKAPQPRSCGEKPKSTKLRFE